MDDHSDLVLSSTPGWLALDQHERKWLQEHTDNAITSFHQSGLKAIQCCAELATIQRFLGGKPMAFSTWLQTSFGGSGRTAYRWLKSYKEMRGAASDEAILYLAQQGIAGLNNIGHGEVASVLRRLPPPETSEKKVLEAWREKVGEQLRIGRRARRKKSLRLAPEDAKKVFITNTVRLLRDSGLKSPAQQLEWLREGVGMIMERRVLSGTFKTRRIPIPEGFMPKRGRPRKTLS